MDITKISEMVGKSTIFSDSFGYFAKTIIGFILLVQIGFIFANNYLLQITAFSVEKISFYIVIFAIVCFLSICMFVGTIHLFVFDAIVYLIGGFIFLVHMKLTLLKVSNKNLKNTFFNKLMQKILPQLINFVEFLGYPCMTSYGLPLLGGDKMWNQDLINTIRKRFVEYFDIKTLSYENIDDLSYEYASDSIKSHMNDFALSIIKGGAIISIYFCYYFYLMGNYWGLLFALLIIILLLIKNRKKLESVNMQVVLKTYISILKQAKIIKEIKE